MSEVTRRSLRRRRVLVGAVGVMALALAGGLGFTVLHRDGERGVGDLVFRSPRTALAGPPPAVAWWSPVRGEPLGVAADGTDVVAAALEEVRLLDGRSGTQHWRAVVPGIRTYRPAIDGPWVAVTTETEVVVLDRASGRRRAAVPFPGPGPVALTRDRQGRPLVVAGSVSGTILAVDASDGSPRWSVQYPGAVTVAPRSDGDVVVAAWEAGKTTTARALDTGSGALRWEVGVGEIAAAPVLAGGVVVVAGGDTVHTGTARALDPATGQERWRVPLAGFFDDAIESAADDHTCYLVDGLGTVTALDLRSGAVLWQRATGRSVVGRRAVLTATSVVFPTFADELVVLDRETGAVRSADLQPGVPIDVTPGAGRLIVALRLGSPSRIEARPEP